MKKQLLIIAVVTALCAGCTTTEYKHPNGAEFKRTAVLNKTGIGMVKFNPETGAFEMEGYASEQTEVAAAMARVAEAAAGTRTK